jgi:hypothetical protein
MRFGLVLGAVASAAPACLCALGASSLVTAARNLLEAASQARISAFGQTLSLNLVEIVRLQPLLEALRSLETLGLLLILGLAAGLVAGLAAASALTAVVVGVAYNLLAGVTGGLEYEAGPAGKDEVRNQRPAPPPSA